jgi:prepilin peptidase CpaA
MMYFLLAAAVAALVAALTDLRSGRIPNWLTFGVLGLGLVAHAVVSWKLGGGWRGTLTGLAGSAGGVVLCAAVPAFFYWKGAMGGGDVKLLAAIGALCRPLGGLEVETYAFVAAALIAPAKLAYDGLLFRTLGRSLTLLVNPLRKPENRKAVPDEIKTWFRMGPAIFLGAAVAVVMHWGA